MLRTILRHLTIETTTAPAEKLRADDGLVVVHRRQAWRNYPYIDMRVSATMASGPPTRENSRMPMGRA